MMIDYLLFRFRRLHGWRSSYVGQVGRALAGVTCGLPVLIFINDHVATITSITGPSMYPYFNEDMHQTTRKYLTFNWRWNPSQNLKRGMIVTF